MFPWTLGQGAMGWLAAGRAEQRSREEAIKPATLIATVFLALVALAHLVRLVLRVEVTVGGVRHSALGQCPGVRGDRGLAIRWRADVMRTIGPP